MATRYEQALLGLATLSLAAGGASAQTVFYVDDDAPLGGDGATWSRAFHDLADAVDAARDALPPVEIRLGNGTYFPDRGSLSRSAVLDLANHHAQGMASATVLSLQGGFAGLGRPDPDLYDPAAYRSIVSGDLAGNDAGGDRSDNALGLMLVRGESFPGTHSPIVAINDIWFRGAQGGRAFQAYALRPRHLALRFERCFFLDNVSDDGGAGLSLSGVIVDMRACRLWSNAAAEDGGALLADFRTMVRIVDSHFFDNAAGWSGGALHAAGSIGIEDTVFSGNTSASGGGAVALDRSDARLERCMFLGNRAGRGGGLDVDDGSIHGTGLVFADNHATFSGGAAALKQCRDSELADSTFTHNTATYSGGGIRLFAADIDIVRCTLTTNTAADGGGIHAEDSPADIVSCVIRGNVAERGGGIASEAGSHLRLDSTLIAENAASERGGALGAHGIQLLTRCTLALNDAPLGSAIYGRRYARFELIDSIVWGASPADPLVALHPDAHQARIANVAWSGPTPSWVGTDMAFTWESIARDDPRFVATGPTPGQSDYRLGPSSPYIDYVAGDQAGGITDPMGVSRLDDNPHVANRGGPGGVTDLGAFEAVRRCSPADVALPVGTLDFADVSRYLDLFDAGDRLADLPGEPTGGFDGRVTFFDAAAFVRAFDAGCP